MAAKSSDDDDDDDIFRQQEESERESESETTPRGESAELDVKMRDGTPLSKRENRRLR